MGMHGFARLDDRIDELTRRVDCMEKQAKAPDLGIRDLPAPILQMLNRRMDLRPYGVHEGSDWDGETIENKSLVHLPNRDYGYRK